jgi:hypothetical protein
VRAVQTETFGSNMDPSMTPEVRCVTFSGSRMVDELLQFASRCSSSRIVVGPPERVLRSGPSVNGDGDCCERERGTAELTAFCTPGT